MLWIDWKTEKNNKKMRVPKTFEGDVHPPHTSPPFFVLRSITGTKYALLSRLTRWNLQLPICFTIPQGLLRSFLFTVRTWRASSEWDFHVYLKGKGFSFCRAKLASQNYLLSILVQKHLGFMAYFPCQPGPGTWLGRFPLTYFKNKLLLIFTEKILQQTVAIMLRRTRLVPSPVLY